MRDQQTCLSDLLSRHRLAHRQPISDGLPSTQVTLHPRRMLIWGMQVHLLHPWWEIHIIPKMSNLLRSPYRGKFNYALEAFQQIYCWYSLPVLWAYMGSMFVLDTLHCRRYNMAVGTRVIDFGTTWTWRSWNDKDYWDIGNACAGKPRSNIDMGHYNSYLTQHVAIDVYTPFTMAKRILFITGLMFSVYAARCSQVSQPTVTQPEYAGGCSET